MKAKKLDLIEVVSILLFYFIGAGNFTLFAQSGIQIPFTIPSPNAASLGIYGEIPVSYNTGLPSINIPLFELKGKSIGLDIYISYHSEGVRPEIHPGWIGQGMTLNAGGAITRIVKNINDELNAPAFPQAGFYYKYSQLNNANWDSNSTLSNYDSYYIGYDTEPDEFVFNFLGYSGKFMLNEFGQWRIQSNDNLKIEFNGQFIDPFISGTSYSPDNHFLSKPFEKFIITDGNGTRYTFGGADAIEYTDEINPALSYRRGELFFATTWYLTKIESADGSESIELNYERGPYISQLYKSISYSNLMADAGGFMDPGCSSWSMSLNYGGSIISPVYLKEIISINHGIKVEFNKSLSNSLRYAQIDYNRIFQTQTWEDLIIVESFNSPYVQSFTQRYEKLRWLKLDEMIVKDLNGSLHKKFQFNYNNDPSKRLFLDELVESGKGLEEGRKYEFLYKDRNLLPGFLATITDHWGFNNGVLFPTSIGSYNPSALRAPNNKVFYGILEEIKYPTGGKTKFLYEMNTYSSYIKNDRTGILLENGIAGGLRISKIINQDAEGNAVNRNYYYQKNYTYGSNNTGSGILNVKPMYSYSFQGVSIGGHSFTYYYSNSAPIIPLTTSSAGKHIAYSEVAEVLDDGSYSVFKFTDYVTNPDGLPNNLYNADYNPYIPFNSHPQERGLLLSKKDFNSQGFPVKEIINTYGVFQRLLSTPAKSVYKKILVQCANQASRQAIIRVAYLHKNHSYLLQSSEEKIYKENSNLIDVLNRTEYGYNNNYLNSPTDITFSDTNGVLYKTENRYVNSIADPPLPLPFSLPPQSHQDYKVIHDLFIRNIVNQPVEIINYKYLNGNYFVTDVNLKRFAFYPSVANKALLSSISNLEENIAIPANNYIKSTINSISGSNVDTRIKPSLLITNYDAKSNIIEGNGNDDFFHSYVWGYGFTYPVAKTINAASSQIAYSSFEDGASGMPLSNWGNWQFVYGPYWYLSNNGKIGNYSVGTTSGVAPIRTVNILPAGEYMISLYSKSSVVDFPTGASKTITYDGSWYTISGKVTISTPQKIEIKITNTIIDELKLWPVNAQMTTYTYDPLLGMTSQTDPNGFTTYYEYDGLGRLIKVLDKDRNVLQEYKYNYANQ